MHLTENVSLPLQVKTYLLQIQGKNADICNNTLFE